MRKSLVVTRTTLMLVTGSAGVTQAQSTRHVLKFHRHHDQGRRLQPDHVLADEEPVAVLADPADQGA